MPFPPSFPNERAYWSPRAFDAAPTDPEPAPAKRGGMKLLKLLAAKLSPEDWADVQTTLRSMAGKPDDDDDATGATDDPPDFPGKPKTGGGMVPLKSQAMDAKARASFHEMHPDAARIAVDGHSSAPARRGPAISSSALRVFEEMYPGVAAIKPA